MALRAFKAPKFETYEQIVQEENQNLRYCFENQLLSIDPKQRSEVTKYTKQNKRLRLVRKFMIDWVTYLAKKSNLTLLTIQVSIIYIDKLFSHLPVRHIEQEKYLWGVVAVLLSSKYNEILPNAIKLKHLQKVSKRAAFPSALVKDHEQRLLKYIKWEIWAKPPLFYYETFCNKFHPEIDKAFLENLRIYCDLALRVDELQKCGYFTQFLACAILSCDRNNYKKSNFEMLIDIFQVSINDIEHCVRILTQLDTTEYQKYCPRSKKRASVSQRREQRIYCNDSRSKRTYRQNLKCYLKKKAPSVCSERSLSRENLARERNEKTNKTELNSFAIFYQTEQNESHTSSSALGGERSSTKLSNWKKFKVLKEKSNDGNSQSISQHSW
ncbi:unnamed protein product [Moneuplotes crassus]|uniref:Cyclin N-terminal domain-containing protein n=1 Tax=Euplotes crassus TaxID=5936 RepID=A0AAD1U2L3_EUPCR|nr:unnamed protein product [Moneuplotes crassus]